MATLTIHHQGDTNVARIAAISVDHHGTIGSDDDHVVVQFQTDQDLCDAIHALLGLGLGDLKLTVTD